MVATGIRSCNSCARRKVRCDHRQPQCSRCRTKAVECEYPSNTPKGTGQNIQRRDDAPVQEREIAPLSMSDSLNVEIRQEASYDGDIALDNELFTFEPGFANTGGEYFDRDIDFTAFLNPQVNEETIQYPSSGWSSLARSSTPSTDQTVQVQQPISSRNVSIPRAPTLNVRSIFLQSNMRSGPQKIASLILHTLKSYPLMMLRHKTLPPFIHPHFVSLDIEIDNMEPLNNCISLVYMIGSEVRGSRNLFWKNVRLECEHLYKEVR